MQHLTAMKTAAHHLCGLEWQWELTYLGGHMSGIAGILNVWMPKQRSICGINIPLSKEIWQSNHWEQTETRVCFELSTFQILMHISNSWYHDACNEFLLLCIILVTRGQGIGTPIDLSLCRSFLLCKSLTDVKVWLTTVMNQGCWPTNGKNYSRGKHLAIKRTDQCTGWIENNLIHTMHLCVSTTCTKCCSLSGSVSSFFQYQLIENGTVTELHQFSFTHFSCVNLKMLCLRNFAWIKPSTLNYPFCLFKCKAGHCWCVCWSACLSWQHCMSRSSVTYIMSWLQKVIWTFQMRNVWS